MELFFFFQAEDGIRYYKVTGVQTCALPICGEERIAAGKKSVVLFVSTASAGYPLALVGLADGAPDHHVVRHFGGNYFGVHGAGADQRGGAEGEIGELLIDLSAVLMVKILPGEVALRRNIGNVFGPALRDLYHKYRG